MRELSTERVEVAGPRGATVMAGEDLGAWMARSGFAAPARRWFSDGGGTVVADQEATWRDLGTGRRGKSVRVATRYRVLGDRVVAVARHDTLAAALEDAGLTGWWRWTTPVSRGC